MPNTIILHSMSVSFMFDDVIYGLPLDGNIMYLFDCTSGNVDTYKNKQ